MMITLVFSGIAVGAVVMATFARYMRRAILALWVAGLGIGAVYLTLGAEFLAVLQWIVSTLVAISFIFFSVMFGEYHVAGEKNRGNPFILTLLSLLLGTGFTAIIIYGSHDLPIGKVELPMNGSDLVLVGQSLTRENLLSLEVLALTLFLVLVGSGVIARSEGEQNS